MDNNFDTLYYNPKLFGKKIEDKREREIEFERWKALTVEKRWKEIDDYLDEVEQQKNQKTIDKNVDMRYLYDDPKLLPSAIGGLKDQKERNIEFARWKALTRDERYQEKQDYYNNRKHSENKPTVDKETRRIEDSKKMYVYTDTVNALENSEATILWLVVMGVGAIFKDRWIIWIVATIIWLSHIFRYKIREYKWDNGGKEEYFKNIEDAAKNGRNNKNHK